MTYCHELLKDIMGDLTKDLPLLDYIRFGSIQPSWSAKAKSRYYFPPPPLNRGFPLLIVNDDNPEGNLRLFNIFNQSFYPFDLPDGYHCCGSSRGWLIIMNSRRKMCLLNPFSKTQIELPTFFLSEREYNDVYKLLGKQLNRPTREIILEKLVVRAVLSADPEKCSDYAIIFISICFSDLRLWRSGDSSWTYIEVPGREFLDVIWYKEAFYALSIFNEVYKVCLNPKLKLKKIANLGGPIYCILRYLVDCMGDLLIVQRSTQETDTEHTYTDDFSIHKLDEETKKFTRLENIGDRALFLGRNSTIAILASEFPGCLSDSIYFTDHLPFNSHEFGYEDLGLYNMKDKKFEIFPPKGVYTPSKFQPLWLEVRPIN